jgi:hypothetical protein
MSGGKNAEESASAGEELYSRARDFGGLVKELIGIVRGGRDNAGSVFGSDVLPSRDNRFLPPRPCPRAISHPSPRNPRNNPHMRP